MDIVRSADGTAIAVEIAGSGPGLVLVSGALGDRQAAGPLAAELAARFRVAAYDRRGRGDSGDNQPYAVEREVEDLAAVIGALGTEAFVYGVSSGAALTIRGVAAGLPVPRMALWEPPFRGASAPPEPRGYVDRLRSLTAAGRPGEALEYFLTAAVGLPAAAVDQMREQPSWAGLERVSPTLVYDALVMGQSRLPADLLGSIEVPALVLNSSSTAPWLAESAEAAARALPRGEHRVLEGGFHAVAPEVLAPVLAGFFAG